MGTRNHPAALAAAGLVLAMLLGGCAAGSGAEQAEAPSAPSLDSSAKSTLGEPQATAAAAPAQPSAHTASADGEPATVAPPSMGTADAGDRGDGDAGEPATDDHSAEGPSGEAAPDPVTRDAAWSFETQNRTMRLTVPAGWTITDHSASALNHDGEQQWNNLVRLTSPEGVQLQYYDGYGSDAGSSWDDYEVVETRETASGQLAMAYWGQADGRVTAHVTLGGLGDQDWPVDSVMLPGIARNHTMGMAVGADWGSVAHFSTRAAAEDFLASDAAQQALDVVASVELLPVPQYEMP